MKITRIHARQILDSRGNPTVECEVETSTGHSGRASVPSGASTGKREALELRDNNPHQFLGKGVQKAIENIHTIIAPELLGRDVTDQEALDQTMIELDGTENKSTLGANAILAVSLACAHAAAHGIEQPLYEYIRRLSNSHAQPTLPIPFFNVINGGKHAFHATDIQEFMIVPHGALSFSHALQMGTEVFHTLKTILEEKNYTTTVGDEGGFAPRLEKGNEEALELLAHAIKKAGYTLGTDISLALDVAASELYQDTRYHLTSEKKTLSSEELIEWLSQLQKKYSIISIEDGLAEDDWEGWKLLTHTLGSRTQLVGDDLFVTNETYLSKGIHEHVANAILLKVNQIGTLTQTLQTATLAQKHHYRTMVSHRSGETEDTTIAHLAVGICSQQIKSGSLSRSERIAKYNELLRIEEHLGDDAKYAGKFPIFHI